MRHVRRNALVPQTAAQMYAIVNDVESYPSFLPWCLAASVSERTATSLAGTLEIGRAGVRVTVRSANRMVPDREIVISQTGGPLKSLTGRWTFEPLMRDGIERGCRVELDVGFEFRAAALTLLFAPLFEHTWDSLVEAFVRRGRALHGAGQVGS
jgi:ribosome-associated toxin RatA of RatAB toxin-antitoxin module